MNTMEAYNRIAADNGLPVIERAGYQAATERLIDPDALWSRLAALAPSQGWLLFQSHQRPFHDGLPQPEADWGVLLACEAVTAEGESLSLAQDGSGGWRLTHYRHDSAGELLRDRVRQLAHDPKTGVLCYWRYWRYEPDQGYVQDRACFIGFE